MKILLTILFLISVAKAQFIPAYFDSCSITRLHNRGVIGTGINVALIGTGSRPDTSVHHLTSVDFTNTSPYDSFGHEYLLINAGANSVTGIAPNCNVFSLKCYNTNALANSTSQTIINALDYCLNNNIQIVSITIGTGTYSALNDKISELWNAGIIVFCSAGNNPGGSMTSAAQCDSSVAIAARDHILGFFNSYLTSHNKITIAGTNGECCVGGTSQAATTFAFMTTLILQRYPTYTPLQIKVALQSVCQKWIPPYNPTYTSAQGITMNDRIGSGYLDSWIY